MSWIRLDDALFQDDWYDGLTDPSKLAWVHLLLFANRNRGNFRRSSLKLLSNNLNLSENSVSEMLKSALENGKILLIDEKTYGIKSWRKYQPDPTNRERQQRHREKQSNGYVTVTERYVTDVTPTSTSTNTKKREKENQVKEKRKKRTEHCFDKNYRQSIENTGTKKNPFVDNSTLATDISKIGDISTLERKKPPRELGIIEHQILEVSNLIRLSKQDIIATRNWLERLAVNSNDQVGWRLIRELEDDLSDGKKLDKPLGVLFWRIKQCIPEVTHATKTI